MTLAMHATTRIKAWMPLAATIVLLVLATVLIACFDLDRRCSALFYVPGKGWPMGNAQPWQWLYRYGTLPGLALALAALGGYLISWRRPMLAPWRRQLLAVVLTAVIGAGVIVNGALKPYWGRPRPGHTQQFGGNWAYRGVWPPGTPGKGQSFPCGHCTMGFLFLSLYGFRRRNRLIAWSGVTTGLLLGVLLSLARILQGAHFLSDALWAMGIIVITAMAVELMLRRRPLEEKKPPAVTAGKRGLATVAAVTAGLVFIAAYLTRRPYYETYQWAFPLFPGDRQVVVLTDIDIPLTRVVYAPDAEPRILVNSSGFGWISATCFVIGRQYRQGSQVVVYFSITPKGYFSDLTHSIIVRLPAHLDGLPVVFKKRSGSETIPGTLPAPHSSGRKATENT